jgi:hypothetical protein
MNLNGSDMRWFLFSLICFFTLNCGDASQPKDVSTVDPNILEPVDSVPIEMHLDSLNDTIALDSIGPTINPEDTNYTKR